MAEILAVEPLPVAIVETVKMESHYVVTSSRTGAPREREPVALEPVITSGLLRIITPTEAELAEFIDLTLHFKGDGEAMTIAVAIARGWPIVTDDRKAIRLIAGRAEVRPSLALVKRWSDHDAIGNAELRQALYDLRHRGNYFPAADHPLRSWWDNVIGGR